MQYKIWEYYMAKRPAERRRIKEQMCKALGIKPQAFYTRLGGKYEDLQGAELLLWKEAFGLKSVEELYVNDK